MATPIPAKAVLEFTPRPRTLPHLARDRARRPNGRKVWFWTQVALQLARLDGREIGVRTSDRWR